MRHAGHVFGHPVGVFVHYGLLAVGATVCCDDAGEYESQDQAEGPAGGRREAGCAHVLGGARREDGRSIGAVLDGTEASFIKLVGNR